MPLLVERLEQALAGIAWEVVFVDDDSPDGTGDVVRDLVRSDPRVRVIERIGRRGLSSASVEGVLSSAAPYFAVMDADLQHDDAVLPEMLRRLKAENLDIVVGSRYVDGERTDGLRPQAPGDQPVRGRRRRLVLHADAHRPDERLLRDDARRPSTRRCAASRSRASRSSSTSSPRRRVRSASPRCRSSSTPASTARASSTAMAAWEFGMLVLDKLIGRYVPVRFVVFAFVGGTGLVVHLSSLYLLTGIGIGFAAAQTIAVFAAMTWNFFLNNLITYRDRRLRGLALLRGLVTFYAICAVGAVANIGVAEFVFDNRRHLVAGRARRCGDRRGLELHGVDLPDLAAAHRALTIRRARVGVDRPAAICIVRADRRARAKERR